MGEEKWTRRETTSVTGSYVPPPVAPDEAPPPPRSDALPRRQPRTHFDRSAGSAPAAEGVTRTVSASATRTGTTQPQPGLPHRVSGAAARRLQVAEVPAHHPDAQLPDNVRYLFRPVLNQPEPAGATVAQPEPPQPEPLELEPSDAVGAPARNAPARNAPATNAPATNAPAHDELAQDELAKDELAKDGPAHSRKAARSPSGTRPAPVSYPAGRRAARRRQLSWAAAVFLVVVTTVSTAYALSGHRRAPANARQASSSGHFVRGQTGSPHSTGAKAITGLSRAAIIRSQAASWIVKEISRSVIIACDDVMCSELFNAGMPASDLLVLGPTAADPLGADVVVGTPALRSQFGSRLAGEYAPSVIASFGAGVNRVDVRVVAPNGAAAYQTQVAQDLAARQRDGTALLHNSSVIVPPSARPELIAGLVDPRLLAMLPVLASQHPIQILGFYDQAPNAGPGVPLSGVELAVADSAAGLSGSQYQRWLTNFFDSQRTPYRAVSVRTVLRHGEHVLLVRFARPSPIGLLNGAVSGGHAY
jgi:hypothetical protein